MRKKSEVSYTVSHVRQLASHAMQDVAQLYRQPFVNRRGRTVDNNKVLFTELIAEELLQENIAATLGRVPSIQRGDYRVDTHTGVIERDSNRKEEIFAKKVFNDAKQGLLLGELGQVLDYQIPLKRTHSPLDVSIMPEPFP
jgi:hypothetical protein